MRVRVQIPPSVDAEMTVVAPNPREDLGVFVQAGDGSRWEFRFRWTGVEHPGSAEAMPVALLQSIHPLQNSRPAGVEIEMLPTRQLPPGVPS
jgi:hypothetical protein